jgi:hypothetical protein
MSVSNSLQSELTNNRTSRFRAVFGIRGLLLVTFVVAIILAFVVRPILRERELRRAMEIISAHGGAVSCSEEENLLGPISISFWNRCELSPQLEASIAAFPQVKRLYVSDGRLNRAHVDLCAKIDTLNELTISGVYGAIDDEDLEGLAQLKNLESLQLEGLMIDGSGISHLEQLESISKLLLAV